MSGDESARAQQARTLRDAAPYLLDHRGKTVVLRMPGSLARSEQFTAWCSDIILLVEVVGMRFAIAFDSGEEIPARMGREQLAEYRSKLDDIHSALEDGFAAAPSHSRGVKTVTGSSLAAHRIGVVDGVDQQLRGEIKPILAADAQALLSSGKIVMLPPLGSGPEGKLALAADRVAHEFAKAARADKLIVLAGEEAQRELGFEQQTLEQARASLTDAAAMSPERRRLLEIGCEALEAGVGRIHYLAENNPASILLEILLPDGIAPMLSRDPFESVRKALASDEAAILELIEPGMESGALRRRSAEEIRESIEEFAVVTRDEAIIACACLSTTGDIAEFGCLAVREDYSNQACGQLLLDYFSAQASASGVRTLLAVSSRAIDWFVERGFSLAGTEALPEERRKEADSSGSRVLARKLA